MRKSVPILPRLPLRLRTKSRQPSPRLFDNSQTLSVLRRILRQPPKDRAPRSLQFLINFTGGIKFFTDLVQGQSEEAHLQCCQHMTYEFWNSDQVEVT